MVIGYLVFSLILPMIVFSWKNTSTKGDLFRNIAVMFGYNAVGSVIIFIAITLVTFIFITYEVPFLPITLGVLPLLDSAGVKWYLTGKVIFLLVLNIVLLVIGRKVAVKWNRHKSTGTSTAYNAPQDS